MVTFLFSGVSLVDWFYFSFNASDYYYSTCVVEEAIHPFSCVIVNFSAKFPLSTVYGCSEIFLVGGSDITSDTAS